MAVQSYKELIAWQKAMELAEEVYLATAEFPPDERFGLAMQPRRVGVSVPSNIAEGQGRGPGEEFARFLRIARGPLQELDTQMLLSVRLGHLSEDRYNPLSVRVVEVARLVNGLLRSF